VRRARQSALPGSVIGGVPAEPDPFAEYRRTHQAHPMEWAADDGFDDLMLLVVVTEVVRMD
jgi:hypothetical protein